MVGNTKKGNGGDYEGGEKWWRIRGRIVEMEENAKKELNDGEYVEGGGNGGEYEKGKWGRIRGKNREMVENTSKEERIVENERKKEYGEKCEQGGKWLKRQRKGS